MLGVTAVTRSVRVEQGIPIQIFPLWLLKWSCNGLKSFSRGLRDVKEGGISARKVAQMWKCGDWAWRNQPLDGRSDKMEEWPLTFGRALLHFFFFFFNQKWKSESEKVPKQGSRDLYRFKTASQESGFGVSLVFLFLLLLTNYLAPRIQFCRLKFIAFH